MNSNFNPEYSDIIIDIENEVRRLLEENAKLKRQLTELSRQKNTQLQGHSRIVHLEEEVSKLRNLVDELQDQEAQNQKRLLQIHTLIEKKLTEKAAPPKQSHAPAAKSPPVNTMNYKPHIGVDEEMDVVTENSSIEEKPLPLPQKKPNPQPNPPKSSPPPTTRMSAPKPRKEESPEDDYESFHDAGVENIPLPDKEKDEEKNEGGNRSEKQKSFIVNPFADEDDPFGDENTKLSDDDFFRSNA